MSEDIFDDVSAEIFEEKDETPEERDSFYRALRYIATTPRGKMVLAGLLKRFRLYKLSCGESAEVTNRREGVRSCALLLLEDLQEVAGEEVDEIISMVLQKG